MKRTWWRKGGCLEEWEGRGCAIKRGVTGLVRKVSQKVVNNNKGNNNNEP